MTPTPTIKDVSRNTRSGTGKQTTQKTSTPTTTNSNIVTQSALVTNHNDNNNNIQQILNTNKLLLSQNAEILKKLNDVEHSIQFLSDKYDVLKAMYDKVVVDNAALQQTNVETSQKYHDLEQQNNELHTTINEIKQNEIKNNLVIFGAPSVKDHHSLQITFKNMLSNLNIPENSIEIEDIYQKKTNTEQSPIFIKFRRLQNKIDFKQAVKHSITTNKKFMYAKDIGFNGNVNKIIFVDQLTEVNRVLLKEAKQLRAHGYKHIWTVNGKILVKRNDDSIPILIKTLNCIIELKNQNVTV